MRYLSLLSLLACAALLACGQEPAPTASGPAGKASAGDLFDLFKAGGSTIVGVDSTAAETETPADSTATAPADTLATAPADTVAAVTGGGGGGDAPSTSISLSARPHTISEDAPVTEIVLTATLDGRALDADATVIISVDPNSEAVREVDYSALFNPLLTIAAGSTSGSVSLLIDPTADSEDEGNETITLTGSTPGLTSGSVQITLSEDPVATVPLEGARADVTPGEALAELQRRGFDIGWGWDSWYFILPEAFLQAAQDGRLEVVELFVVAGLSVDFAYEDGRTALHRAAEEGHVAVVRYLVEQGADVDARAFWYLDRTPLHYAARRGHLEVVEFLVGAGADVNARNALA